MVAQNNVRWLNCLIDAAVILQFHTQWSLLFVAGSHFLCLYNMVCYNGLLFNNKHVLKVPDQNMFNHLIHRL
jgi:hypothetical protein